MRKKTGSKKGVIREVLDPTDRFSEVVFGVIMAVSFTGTISVTTGGEQDIRQILYAALGCNIAWGIVDAVMYVITNLAERGRGFSIMRAIATSPNAEAGQRIVAQALPESLARIMPVTVLDGIRAVMASNTSSFSRPHISRDDLAGALGVFLLVLMSTLPVTLPFVLFQDVAVALRASNAVALVLLFMCGFGLGHYAGFGAWRSGFAMLAIGMVLVAVIIALGG